MPYLPGNDTQSPDTGAFGPMQPAKRPLKTRLKELEKAATNFAGADMGDARTRRRAERAVFWLDHGFVRAGWTNQAEIAPGVFRSNQPGFRRLARAKAQGIDTVLSLRGDGVSAWQRLEAQYCAELGLDLHTAALRSSRAPEAAALLRLLDLFPKLPRPFLMHCKSGADRAGLVSALWLMEMEGKPPAEAAAMLSPRFVHFRWMKTGVLDAFLEAYAARLAKGAIPLRDWIADEYDADRLQSDFNAARRKKR